MLTKQEMLRAIKEARDIMHDYVPVSWVESITRLEEVVASLLSEAEPLAVLFEGWISDNELGTTAKELASGYTYLRLSKIREQPTDHAVTFAITPRKGVADDA